MQVLDIVDAAKLFNSRGGEANNHPLMTIHDLADAIVKDTGHGIDVPHRVPGVADFAFASMCPNDGNHIAVATDALSRRMLSMVVAVRRCSGKTIVWRHRPEVSIQIDDNGVAFVKMFAEFGVDP